MLKEVLDFVKPGSKAASLAQEIDFTRLPKHVAIIMDGNGRWAKRRRLPRIEGHRAGAKSGREILELSARLGVKYLTLFAFSKENWKRPKREISTLWKLLREYLKKEDKTLVKNDLRMIVIGQRDDLPDDIQSELIRVEELTKNNKRLTVILALNYGGRAEIVDAVKKILLDKSVDPASLTEDVFSSYLYTSGVPDPDLLIRTSGEQRISNFLLWEIAYSEIWITSEFWPDFRSQHFLQAIIDFQKRERRFGDIHPPENMNG